MISLKDFLESNRRNNMIIQMGLREIDMEELAIAMLGYDDEEQEAILRNMSRRAAEMLKEEVAALQEKRPPDRRIERAVEFFAQRLKKYSTSFDELESSRPTERPEIRCGSPEALTETFVRIIMYAQSEGIIALDGIEETTDHPIMKRAMQYYIDGWEPMLSRSMLERAKKEYLRREELIVDMMIEGADALYSSENPVVIRERLSSFLVS